MQGQVDGLCNGSPEATITSVMAEVFRLHRRRGDANEGSFASR